MSAPSHNPRRFPGSLVSSGSGDVWNVGYLPTLDGWRAVAILAVMLFHGTLRLVYTHPRLTDWVHRGRFGVDIFFALSGFLICSRLIDELNRTGKVSLAGFYIRRCFRILPPYVAYLSVVGIMSLLGVVALSGAEWASVLLFWRNFVPKGALSTDNWFFSHLWSLSVEEQFYCFWPSTLLLLGITRAKWAALLIAVPIALWRGVTAPVNYIYWHDPHWDKLVFGAVLALWMAEPANRDSLRRWLKPWVFALLGLLALAGMARRVPFSGAWLGVLFPLLIIATVLNPAWRFSRLLESPIIRWIGRLSYSLYIWQELFLSTQNPPRYWLQSFPINFLAAFACAALSYYLLERPLISAGHRLAKRVQAKRDSAQHESPAFAPLAVELPSAAKNTA